MAPAKPASVRSTTNPPSTSFIRQSGGTFIIKQHAVRGRHGVHRYEELTSDGDGKPVYDHNGMQNAHYTIRGFVMSGVSIGIQQLSGTSNPGTFVIIRERVGSTNYIETVTLLVLNIETDWQYAGVGEKVVITGIATSTTASAIESTS